MYLNHISLILCCYQLLLSGRAINEWSPANQDHVTCCGNVFLSFCGLWPWSVHWGLMQVLIIWTLYRTFFVFCQNNQSEGFDSLVWEVTNVTSEPVQLRVMRPIFCMLIFNGSSSFLDIWSCSAAVLQCLVEIKWSFKWICVSSMSSVLSAWAWALALAWVYEALTLNQN